MINLSPDRNLKLLLQNTNKALAVALKDASPAQLQKLTKMQDLSSLLENLFKKSSTTDESQNKALLELLKNNSTLKSLSNPISDIKALLTLLKQDTKGTQQLQKTLKNLLANIKDIEPKELQNRVKNSGVFLENQIKKSENPKELFSKDFKALLLQTHEKFSNAPTTPNSQEILKHIDKLTLTIEYNQLLSHLDNAPTLYIPYSWDALEEGAITIKKMQKKHSICDIHLQLKEYGKVDLRLALFEKNELSIYITTESKTLKKSILENAKILKKQLSNASLRIKEMRFVTKKQQTYERTSNEALAMGFEVKV